MSCWFCAGGALGRLAAPLTALLQPRASRRRAPGTLGFLTAPRCRLAPGCRLQRGIYGEDRLGLVSTGTPRRRWGPPWGHQCLSAKLSRWPCFYLPHREKRSRITVPLIAHRMQAAATMLCYYYHYYHAVCETEFVRKDNLAY